MPSDLYKEQGESVTSPSSVFLALLSTGLQHMPSLDHSLAATSMLSTPQSPGARHTGSSQTRVSTLTTCAHLHSFWMLTSLLRTTKLNWPESPVKSSGDP